MAAITKTPAEKADAERANRDPITGAPGAHPLGVGASAAAGGAAVGAAVGAIGGTVGVVAGAAIGAVAGGYAGKAVAEKYDPTVEDAYWRENYRSRPYIRAGAPYTEYQSAYRYGWEAPTRFPERNFDAVEKELERDWVLSRGLSTLDWPSARHAARDAWDRVKIPRKDSCCPG